ncbi:glycine-rich domain-containing protein [Polyangium sorediatum]|uniref:Uncharacterized protein n=1 Tax=Polyangium sorediatum TaxID=889274 RepID=A0ABT6P1W5_9BACT|nr:hypothetical protein [Polyangium sorediatum]MDI1434591.1 hypothetical protein [Polyangium sorediatum]
MAHANGEHFAHEVTLASCGSWGVPARKQKLSSLDEVLAYRNRDVVQRFLVSYPMDPADAEEIFTETKRWLWLIGQKSKLRSRRRLLVTQPMAALDEMWHCFLLFTQNYGAFCARFFGQFIHHEPVTLAEKARARRRMQKDPEGFARAFARQMEWQYEFVAEHLGEETLRRWYVELPLKYPMEMLQRLNAQSAVAGRHR